MITLTYYGNFDLDLLKSQLLEYFPTWREQLPGNVVNEYFGWDYEASTLKLFVPDNTDTEQVDAVIIMHDASAAKPLDWPGIIVAKNKWINLPNYATWTAEEAEEYIISQIFGGWTQAQIDDWIDTNVTTLATAKTAMKSITAEIVDIREITSKMGYLLMLLRDIVVKRSNL